MKTALPKATTANRSDQRIVRAKVIAERYDVSERCVHQWGESGRIPRIKIGKTVRFNLAAVVAAIEGGAA
jgi:predicted DNA-binding transcriptional regulator AlpA